MKTKFTDSSGNFFKVSAQLPCNKVLFNGDFDIIFSLLYLFRCMTNLHCLLIRNGDFELFHGQ